MSNELPVASGQWPEENGKGGAPTPSRWPLATGHWPLVLATIVVFAIPAIASACPVCYGNPNAPMNKGTSTAIFFLLGIVGFVQAGFIALFFTFWKRARELKKRRESFAVIDGGVR